MATSAPKKSTAARQPKAETSAPETAPPPPRALRVAYLGNFGPEHSTENHVARALRNNGHELLAFQEGDEDDTAVIAERADEFDLILWTRTKGLADRVGEAAQWRLIAEARHAGVPIVGYHLDLWWGLEREKQIFTDPFFRVDLLCTADGGHDEQWAKANVNHAWFPAGISRDEAEIGMFRPEFASDIAFVGSWQGGYHPEHSHRAQLIKFLQRTYGERVRFWPEPGRPAVRGKDLQDLYASVKVVVGDSCLVNGQTHYWSDRVPETIGRGGFLLHPFVEGLDTAFNFYFDGQARGDGLGNSHLGVWGMGDWGALRDLIESMLDDNDEMRAGVAATGRRHVLEHHTYERRMEQLVELIDSRRARGQF